MTNPVLRYALLCLLVVSVASCFGGPPRGERERALKADLEALPLSAENISLVADLGGGDCDLEVESVTLTSCHIIVEDVKGRLFALDRKSLMPAWHYYGLTRPMDFPLYEAAGSYLMVTDNMLYQVSKATGTELAVHHLTFTPSSAPAGNDATAYIGSWASPAGNKTIYSVNLADGRVGWGYRTDGHITSRPLVHGAPRQLVYFASHDMTVTAVEAAGAFEAAPPAAWMSQTFGCNSADLALAPAGSEKEQDLLLVASEEGALYAYGSGTGTKQWEYVSGRPLKTTPAGTANAVYFHNEYGFHCLSRVGDLKWKLEDGACGFVMERDGNAWLRDAEGNLVIVADDTGEITETFDLQDWFLPMNTTDGTFFAVSGDGFVFAFTQRLKLK
jgi:outer membrane protein assembly factor BamB